MHEAYVCGLAPATTYYYRVGGGPAGDEVWSDVYCFTTTPSDPAAPVTIGVTGDSRGQEATRGGSSSGASGRRRGACSSSRAT